MLKFIHRAVVPLKAVAGIGVRAFHSTFGVFVMNTSLSYRILKRGIFSVILIIICIAVPMYTVELYSDRGELRVKSDQIVYRIANTFAMPFWSLDDRMVTTLINIELLDPAVVAVALYHENGDFYSGQFIPRDAAHDNLLGSETANERRKKSMRPLDPESIQSLFRGDGLTLGEKISKRSTEMVMNGRVFGRVDVYFTDAYYMHLFFSRMMKTMLLIIVVSIATFFITHRSIRRRVILPIEKVSNVVGRFRNKDFTARTEIVSDDEIGALSSNFNIMADTIQQYSQSLEAMVAERTQQLVNSEKMAALGELLAGISHEVNTPVGTALTAASYLDHKTREITVQVSSGKLTASDFSEYLSTSKEALSLTISNLQRAAELVQSFKKIASDRSSAERRKFNLKEYIGDVVNSLRPRLKRTSHKLIVECPADLDVDSYPGEISQIISNFILNSLAHAFTTDSGGVMSINVRKEGNLIVLVYSDNGAGIPEENLSKIFNPFFTTKRGSGGSGLGLNIVYNIVTQTLGGSIECGSEKGKGTTFTIIFPDNGSSV